MFLVCSHEDRMQGPLSSYPWVVVRLACRVCPRKGQYRLARLAAKFGPEAEIDDVVELLSRDCPWRDERRSSRYGDPHCGAYLPDLENRPPPDAPPRPRQRLRVVK
jgi:hypothetical protein